MNRVAFAVLAASAFWTLPAVAAPPVPGKEARTLYESGVRLFENQKYEQAIVEFTRSYQAKAVPASLFMMAQSEYYSGRFKEARAHYAAYLAEEKDLSIDFREVARDRIESIDHRKSVFAINTIPEGVQVVIEGKPGTPPVIGTAPNNFEVAPGHYVIRLQKPNHKPAAVEYDIDIIETKPLFFKLDPIPARLEITTVPKDADLFVNDNSTRNPYRQNVVPGRYEIFARARDHSPKAVAAFDLGPGERKELKLDLDRVQRSGDLELVAWTTALGMAAGGSAVLTLTGDPSNPGRGAAGALVAGTIVGGVAALVPAILIVPRYITDNRALFIIGGEWMGAAEGVAVGLTFKNSMGAGLIGGLAGFATGTVTASVLKDRAPTYGRVALIQSGAIVGATAGALAIPSLEIDRKWLGPGVLVGLNAGLAAGLALAYLPDQSVNGPTWKRIILIDAMAAAGALVGVVASTVKRCSGNDCSIPLTVETARLTLGIGLVGLVAGIILTRNLDYQEAHSPTGSSPPPVAIVPSPSVMVVDTPGGGRAIPSLAAVGRF